MADKVAGQPLEGTPPADLSAFPSEVLTALLGREPPHPSLWAVEGRRRPRSIAMDPLEWPADWPGLEYLHRALARLLWERGGTVEAAASIRRGLVEGHIPMVIVYDDGDEEPRPIPGQLWRAAKAGAEMLWSGRSMNGFIYLSTAAVDGTAKPLELAESDALCKLLLHLAGKKSAAQIANNSSGTGYAVPERTVSYLLRRARDLLSENTK